MIDAQSASFACFNFIVMPRCARRYNSIENSKLQQTAERLKRSGRVSREQKNNLGFGVLTRLDQGFFWVGISGKSAFKSGSLPNNSERRLHYRPNSIRLSAIVRHFDRLYQPSYLNARA